MEAREAPQVDDKYLIVILVLVILFGASRLPSLGRNFGKGIHEFRNGIAESTHDDAGAAGSTPPEDDHRTAD
jgi:sec-independent protein translocase protein TatA